MTEFNGKTILESVTETSQVILPNMTNPVGNAHGGELLKMMDNTASVCAIRHSREVAVTISVDNVHFNAPVHVGNLAICSARMTYAGKSSMEIAVTLDAEDLLSGERRCCVTAYFSFVAIGKDLKTTEIPSLILEKEEELLEAKAASERMKRRREDRVCWLNPE